MSQHGLIKRSVARWIVKAARNLGLQNVGYSSWWSPYWGPILEGNTGDWQRNIVTDSQSTLLTFSALFACVTGIASDIAKMRVKLCRNEGGIWTEITESETHGNDKNRATLKLLRKPNSYQNRIKFFEQWIISKLLWGNAYILKQRDSAGNVVALYVLDPQRVTVLVSEGGDVYYQVRRDPLSEVKEDRDAVPASEIIHDMMVSLWHPLVGVSPIYACGVSATMGNRIQANSTTTFANASRPSGVVTAPERIEQADADRLKADFETKFGGANIGRVAVLGDGMKFEAITMHPEAMQLIEQLKWTVSDVCRPFHYPEWKAGGALPPYSAGPEALTTMYYTDCLQGPIESLELCLDEGLGLDSDIGTEMDLDNLMRMDTNALYDSTNKAGKIMKLDEQRFRLNLKPLPLGGNTVYLQQQDFSVEALAKRDQGPDPFASKSPAPTPPPPTQPPGKSMMTVADLEVFEAGFEEEVYA